MQYEVIHTLDLVLVKMLVLPPVQFFELWGLQQRLLSLCSKDFIVTVQYTKKFENMM